MDQENKINFKDLNGWLKFGIVGGVIYSFYLILILLGLIIGIFIILLR